MTPPQAKQAEPTHPLAFLCPFEGRLLKPAQAAAAMGRTVDFIYDLIDSGAVEAFAPIGRKKARYTITKRSVLLAMVREALFRPEDMPAALAEVAATLTPEQRREFSRLFGKLTGEPHE